MTPNALKPGLSEQRRKEIFRALVGLQDRGLDLAQSRRAVVEQFGVTESQVRHIEREGVANDWPPL